VGWKVRAVAVGWKHWSNVDCGLGPELGGRLRLKTGGEYWLRVGSEKWLRSYGQGRLRSCS
jgi:hypothetical protein